MCKNCLYLSYFNSPLTLQAPLRVTGVSLSKEVHMRKPSLNVTWSTLPLSLVSVYELQHRIKDTSWELQVDIQPSSQSYFQPYSQSYVLPNLVPGTAYNVRMRAVYGAENGEWSEVHTETTFDSELNPLHVQLCHHAHVIVNLSYLSVCQNCAVATSLPC